MSRFGLEDKQLSMIQKALSDFPEIEELDINPLVASAEGAIAVDARVLLRD